MDEEAQEALDFDEIEFYGCIRKHLICLLFFAFLYLISFSVIKYFKTRADNDELYAGDEDFFVYRVSVWICSFSLSISIGAVTLLPFSVLGLEVLHLYPENYYLKWLNLSLINSLWNYVFLLSNLSMFILLPFAYFFIESQGFGSWNLLGQNLPRIQPRPLLARVYETVAVCALVIVILVGITDVFYSLVLPDLFTISFSLLCLSCLSTPLLYSFVSLIGVFLLLLSAPLGFAKMFDLFSELLISPRRKSPPSATTVSTTTPEPNFATTPQRLQAMSYLRYQARLQRSALPQIRLSVVNHAEKHLLTNGNAKNGLMPTEIPNGCIGHFALRKVRLKNSVLTAVIFLDYVKYPIIMLVLLILTMLSLSMVAMNIMQLAFGIRGLPEYVQYVELRSRHRFGVFGALVENAIILYIIGASLVGIYSMPLLRRMRPRRSKTSMTSIIVNCTTILVLSSALPVLARTLGITSFDLLGNYGRLNWISNFSLVWSYNVLFAALTIFCLVNKFTLPVRRELIRRFYLVRHRRWSAMSSNSESTTRRS